MDQKQQPDDDKQNRSSESSAETAIPAPVEPPKSSNEHKEGQVQAVATDQDVAPTQKRPWRTVLLFPSRLLTLPVRWLPTAVGMSTRETRQEVFNAAIAIGTVGSLVILGIQSCELRKQSIELQTQSVELQKQSAAAVIASKAAETQLLLTLGQLDASFESIKSQERIAREGIVAQQVIAGQANALTERGRLAETERFRLQQRARIVFDSKEGIIVQQLKVGAVIRLMLTFRNVGNTEARNYRQAATFVIRPINNKFVPEMYPVIIEVAGTASVAANAPSVYPMTSGGPISKELVDGLSSEKPTLSIYMFGRVRYEDEFGIRHHWRFCRGMNMRTNVVSVCDSDQEQEENTGLSKPQ